jgi:pyruvate dehydrogenase E1 component alpha subunit
MENQVSAICARTGSVAVGVCSALRLEDAVFGNHRSHGHYLAKGGSLKGLFAEIYGKEDGCSRGRGGSMHLIDAASNMMGSAPIVAGTISLALGSALASQIRNDGRISVSFFGDGATGEGVLCESLNLQRKPIIFICENNLYSTHISLQITSLTVRNSSLWNQELSNGGNDDEIYKAQTGLASLLVVGTIT